MCNMTIPGWAPINGAAKSARRPADGQAELHRGRQRPDELKPPDVWRQFEQDERQQDEERQDIIVVRSAGQNRPETEDAAGA